MNTTVKNFNVVIVLKCANQYVLFVILCTGIACSLHLVNSIGGRLYYYNKHLITKKHQYYFSEIMMLC